MVQTLSLARKAELETGTVATKNFIESFAINPLALIQAVAPQLGLQDHLPSLLAALDQVMHKGISHQITAIGVAIGKIMDEFPEFAAPPMMNSLIAHPSDMVRSWAVFAVGRLECHATLEERLESIRPFAADSHFAVREWAQIAVRPYIAAHIRPAIESLQQWALSEDENIRRFAVESTRPRGVWTVHIACLKQDPSIAEPLLEALKQDPSIYVQKSVANWLNDASKTSPEWVIELCKQWDKIFHPATLYIIKQALRTIKKSS